jgi:hypothetical protein
MNTSKLASAVFGAILLAGVSIPASAHHNANAEWRIGEEVPLVGVLAEVRDIVPHAIWMVNVKNAQGKYELWHLETIGTNAFRRQGVSVKQDLKVGQTYTFFIAPARKAGERGGFLTGMIINGKKLTIVRL